MILKVTPTGMQAEYSKYIFVRTENFKGKLL
jgi:hypothetical protein